MRKSVYEVRRAGPHTLTNLFSQLTFPTLHIIIHPMNANLSSPRWRTVSMVMPCAVMASIWMRNHGFWRLGR